MNIILSNIIRTICLIYIVNNFYNKHSKLSSSFSFCAVSVLYCVSCILLHHCYPYHSTLLSLLLFCIYIFVLYKFRWTLAFSTSIISFALFYAANDISSCIVIILCIPLYYINLQLPHIIQILLAGFFSYSTICSVLKVPILKRLKKTPSNNKENRLLLLVSILILVIKYVDSQTTINLSESTLLPLSTILLAFLLFTWWRKQITKSYIEKLRKLEVQSLYDELEEKEQQIQKLASDNESLARIVHKDNKLIPAMEHAVTSFLSSDDFHDPIKASQYGMELTQKLRNIALERQGTLDTYDNENHKLRLTGHVSLDAILVYMKKKADANHISFECRHTPETLDYLFTKITEDDLIHLLSDLIENAIIAMRGQESGRLQITFGKLQKEAYLSIADSGIPFDIATLHSFGLQAHTTHTDSGGNGIGLMDIWQIKRKYRATIQIQEYENLSNSFSKRVLFSFNSKNHYVIQSFRHEEIRNIQTRGDLYVIPAEAKEKNEGKQHERNTETLNS